MELDEPRYDWRPTEMPGHPDHTFKKDPWTSTALMLAEQKMVPHAGKPFRMADMFNDNFMDRMLLKALGISARGTAKVVLCPATPESGGLDMVVAKYKSGVEFEIRRCKFVWVLVPAQPIKDLDELKVKLGLSLTRYPGSIVKSTLPPEASSLRAQIVGDDLPPYLADATVHETPKGLILAGSLILEPPQIPISHQIRDNRQWFPR
ncbi:hypothetical protein [Roseimicrobium sp. ORNL1]|uniref:hypothetical protein n=1 Tax=Roseimicrobium sp. ORNL1 TaxID=2711231 RepID=UPI0013E1DA66|nr:hypothetical protein [Roseimicrobium sp. ORNL1]QIF03388.1 hypothetical protein G5S37_18270 [Roseimicrobium sp. ORNL1]